MSEGVAQQPPWTVVFQRENGGHFRLACAGLCSVPRDPVSWEQGSPGEEEGRGHLGVRPELGLAGGDGLVRLHLTGQRKKQDPSRKSRLPAGEDSVETMFL